MPGAPGMAQVPPWDALALRVRAKERAGSSGAVAGLLEGAVYAEYRVQPQRFSPC